MVEDLTFGPVIALGPSAARRESGQPLPDECAYEMPPLNLPLAHALLGQKKVRRLLSGIAEEGLEALARSLVRVAQMVVDIPDLAGLAIDPLVVGGGAVTAGDATVALRPAGQRARLAISPYPEELAELFESRDGEGFVIRPIRPEDAEAHGALFRRLAPQDIRLRFFSPIRELSPEQMARLTQIDYDCEMAFIAVHRASGETVGVARLVREQMSSDCSGDGGEFAVIVEQSVKGKGIARRLMERLIEWGRAQGMRWITGQVLAENAPMLAFVKRLGFAVRRVPGESDIVEARLDL